MKKCIALMIASVIVIACGTSDASRDDTPTDNEPWRVIVDDHQEGGPINAGIRTASHADEFEHLWDLLGRGADKPSIDFNEEILIAYALSYPSGCEFPFIGLMLDDSNAVITADFAGNEPAECAADENQYLVMVGIDRGALTRPRYDLTTSVDGQVATIDL